MAARLIQQPRRVVTFLPSLRAACSHFRAFSSYDEQQPDNNYVVVSQPAVEDSTTVWPDSKLGVLGPKDSRFPYPGLTGPFVGASPVSQVTTPAVPPSLPDILTSPTAYERQAFIVEQMANMPLQDDEALETQEIEEALLQPTSPQNSLECQAMECPVLVKKDFQSLFPSRDLSGCPLTVITISQKTMNDMTSWTPEVEEEREELMGLYVEGAKDICKTLESAGFWADFLDPDSGTPFLGAHTNSAMFETDDRYKHFGFAIEDLGCCKVISHHLWGTHTFVGCLFTNAPLDHPLLVSLMKKKCWNDKSV